MDLLLQYTCEQGSSLHSQGCVSWDREIILPARVEAGDILASLILRLHSLPPVVWLASPYQREHPSCVDPSQSGLEKADPTQGVGMVSRSASWRSYSPGHSNFFRAKHLTKFLLEYSLEVYDKV